MSKPFYLSKTVWFNVIAFVVVGILPSFGYTGVIPDSWAPFVLPALTLINVVLRFVTNQAVGLRKS